MHLSFTKIPIFWSSPLMHLSFTKTPKESIPIHIHSPPIYCHKHPLRRATAAQPSPSAPHQQNGETWRRGGGVYLRRRDPSSEPPSPLTPAMRPPLAPPSPPLAIKGGRMEECHRSTPEPRRRRHRTVRRRKRTRRAREECWAEVKKRGMKPGEGAML